MRIMAALLIATLVLLVTSAPTPPNYNYSFHILFDETFVQNGSGYKVNGQLFYDPAKNRERVDRVNGKYDLFCGTVLPNVTTSCQQITKNDKRFIIFPQKSQCCFCCDSAHGCGILKPDWIADGQYKGRETIIDTPFDKWSKDGMFGYNYLWVTADDNKVPRRLNENGEHITDYIPHTFMNQTFPDTTFALPGYCNESTPTNCPLTSICGKLRGEQTTE